MNEFITLLLQHQWVPAAAVAIFFLVRLLKSESVPYPLSVIPPKARTLVVVVLGFVGAALQAIVVGVSWQQALAENGVAALLAVLSHDTFIEWMRNGRELFSASKDSKK